MKESWVSPRNMVYISQGRYQEDVQGELGAGSTPAAPTPRVSTRDPALGTVHRGLAAGGHGDLGRSSSVALTS